MLQKTKKLVKANIKMKGLHTPQIILLFKGKRDNRKGLVVERGESYESPYLNKKAKDLHEYTAKMYQCTSELLSQLLIEREQIISKLQLIEKKLKNSPENLSKPMTSETHLTIKELRRFKVSQKEKADLEERKEEYLCRLKEIEETIREAETETAEMILACKRKLEGFFMTYMSGAHKVTSKTALDISTDQTAVQIYREHVHKNYK